MREPWCHLPAEVADLTDFQVAYVLAAQARQNERHEKAMRAKDGGGPAPGPPPTGGRIDREYAVAFLMEQHGHTRESAEAAVDKAMREGG